MVFKVKFNLKRNDFNTKNISQKKKRYDDIRRLCNVQSDEMSKYYSFIYDYKQKQLNEDRLKEFKKLDKKLFTDKKISKRFFK